MSCYFQFFHIRLHVIHGRRFPFVACSVICRFISRRNRRNVRCQQSGDIRQFRGTAFQRIYCIGTFSTNVKLVYAIITVVRCTHQRTLILCRQYQLRASAIHGQQFVLRLVYQVISIGLILLKYELYLFVVTNLIGGIAIYLHGSCIGSTYVVISVAGIHVFTCRHHYFIYTGTSTALGNKRLGLTSCNCEFKCYAITHSCC